MSQANSGEVTIEQIAASVPASLYSVRKSLTALGIKGRIPLENRRIVLYPSGTIERVRQWLIQNNQ